VTCQKSHSAVGQHCIDWIVLALSDLSIAYSVGYAVLLIC
jgi:hypothetical protein